MSLRKDIRLFITNELTLNSEKYQEEIWDLVSLAINSLKEKELETLGERISLDITEEDEDE